MKLEELQKAMIEAMKAKDKARKESISVLVSAVKKAGIDAGCREDIPEEMVNQAVLKEIKTVMAELKGKADGKVINQAVADLTK